MAAGDYVEKGAVVDIGLGTSIDATHGLIISITHGQLGQINNIMGEQGATVQRVITNPGKTIKAEMYVARNATATVTALLIGGAVTINNVAYCLTSTEVTKAPAAATRWSMAGEAPDSLTAA